jgi:hypothetical protein
MATLPDDALIVRGGLNLPKNFERGSGVSIDKDDILDGVSVISAVGKTVAELVAPNAAIGYPGIRHNQVGVTTAGKVRSAGGDVTPSPTKKNPHHATLNGLTAIQVSELFRPTIDNPSNAK